MSALFNQQRWPTSLVTILLCSVISLMIASGHWWGVFSGLQSWGDNFNHWIGLGTLLGLEHNEPSAKTYSISLTNIGLIAGSFCAALLSNQFQIRLASKQEYLMGAASGVLMGSGASLAGGCTIGGFITPLILGSPAGWTMWLGLLLGSIIGLKLVIKNLVYFKSSKASRWPSINLTMGSSRLVGIVATIIFFLSAIVWLSAREGINSTHQYVIFAGFALGIFLQRSRFCISNALREPFLTSDISASKALILMLACLIPISSFMMQRGFIDFRSAIPPTFWIGSFTGGVIFGIGMILAGGCASGALWRAGEGHTKLWVTLFFFAWTGSTLKALATQWGFLEPKGDPQFLEKTSIGQKVFLPDTFDSWAWVYLLNALVLGAWYLFIRYNLSTRRFTLI